MITAHNLSEALRVLDLFKDATLTQLTDPEWVGKLQAHAHLVSRPIKYELKEIDVEIA